MRHLFVLAFVFFGLQTHALAQGETPVNAHMAHLHEYLIGLAPYIYNADAFDDDRNEDAISKNLQGLEKTTLQMEHKKVFSKNLGATVLFDVLTKTLGDANNALAEGSKDYARFMTRAAISTCASCHTSGISTKNFSFLEDQKLFDSLSRDSDRIQLLLTTRQFEKAKDLCENILSGYPANGAKPLDLDTAVQQLAVYFARVNPSADKAKEEFAKLEKNKALPKPVLEDIKDLLKGLSAKKVTFTKKQTALQKLALIRKQIDYKKGDTLLSYDNALVLPRMQALGELHKMLTANEFKTPNEVAEALHLLGLINNLLNRETVAQIDDAYFSVCIETLPHTETAVRCYSSLEDSVTTKSSGSGGVFMDLEDVRMLARYKRLAYPFVHRLTR